MKPCSNLIDIRQTKEYACFMKKIGWQVEILQSKEKTHIFIKKLPILPFSIIKILRCNLPKNKKGLKRFSKQIDQIGKKHHPLLIKLQPFLLQNQKNPHYSKDKSPLIPTKSIWIDLTKNETQILKQMKQKTRYNIRLAKKRKLKVVTIPGNKITNNQLLDFYNLWKKNKPFNWLFKPNFNELKYLTESFGKKCFFVLSYSSLRITNSSLLAGALILCSNSMSFYWHNCSTRRGKKFFCPTLCVWETIKESKKRGLQIFDLEGIYDKRFPKLNKGWKGFSRFKKNFGGKEIEFAKPAIYTSLNFLNL